MQTVDIDKILMKVFVGLGEVFTIIIISILSLLIFLARKYIYNLLKLIGLNYFKERLEIIREINSDLLWCQGALRADTYALFRTHNGTAWVQDVPKYSNKHSDRNKTDTLYRKINIKKINSKPHNFYSDILDTKLYKAILDLTLANDWQLISYDAIKRDYPTSELIVFFEEYGIENLLSYRIWDKNNKTFGLIFFTWGEAPSRENLFTRDVSKKLDSVAIRFQNYIISSISEKFFNLRINI